MFVKDFLDFQNWYKKMAYTSDEKIDLLFQSILELKESIKTMSESHDKDFAEMRKSHDKDFAEMRKSQAEMDRKFQETDRKFQETDRKFQESKKMIDEMSAKVKEIWTQFGNLWITHWEIVEDGIYRNLEKELLRYWIDVHWNVFRNKERKNKWEYDVFAVNDTEMVIVEVKNKFRENQLDEFMNVKLPRFKTLFPQYSSYKIYGGIWALVMFEEVEQKAKENWLFVFTQTWNIFEAKNPSNFKPKIYA